eukprot:CAMPEP_0185308432 /NCGR_PEP_ID=MMETSP1363-20130426/19800_1 /TAXON_ID=38817 /ORGANISM="Gephyrocapsa oceanica, Strain RCC1303" /LENGTH=110 /DNA_ID=CAMNT_0027905855 /DNA_START=71 /DNA_END=399 /DNA_ORIENTATION=-
MCSAATHDDDMTLLWDTCPMPRGTHTTRSHTHIPIPDPRHHLGFDGPTNSELTDPAPPPESGPIHRHTPPPAPPHSRAPLSYHETTAGGLATEGGAQPGGGSHSSRAGVG